MDTHGFDEIVRALSERGSRRGALRLLAGIALGALAGAPTPGALTTAKRKKKKRKGKCSKKPCPRGQKRNRRSCKCECVRTTCGNGQEFDVDQCKCVCPPGTRGCGKKCIANNACCAATDETCPEDPRGCCNALRLEKCTIDGCCAEIDGQKVCNNFCVDTSDNPNHCGRCNRKCAANETCLDGECKPNACPPERRCDGVCCPPGETCSVDGKCEDRTKCPREVCSSRNLGCCPPNSWTDSAYCRPQGCACVDTFIGYDC